MHIQKLLLAMICMAVFAGGLEAQTADTEAQARARELLRQKEAELNATNAPARVIPAPAIPAPPQAPSPEVVTPVVPLPVTPPAPPAQEPAAPPVPQPTPTVVPTVPPPAPVAAAPAFTYGQRLSPEDEARLREATRKAIDDLNTQAAAAKPPTPMPVTPVPATPVPISPAPLVVTPAPLPVPTAATDDQSPAQLKAAQKAEAKILAKQKKEEKKEAKMAGNYEPAPMPAPVPAYVTPNSQEGRLYDLLQRYNRDEITPADYHAARAKILAEP